MCRIDELKPELLESLSGLAPQRTSVALFSTVEGRAIDGTELTPAYWARNMREPVAFAAAIEALLETKRDLFLEVGPHPVLSTPIFETARHAGHEISVVSSLRRDEPERAALLGSLGHLYSLGCEIRIIPGNGNGSGFSLKTSTAQGSSDTAIRCLAAGRMRSRQSGALASTCAVV